VTSEQVLHEDIVSAVKSSVQEVFSTMLNLPLAASAAREEEDEPTNFDGVVALVGIGGSWTGSGRIICTPRLACRLAGALLMAPYEAVDEDVLDAIGELANMIIGSVKTIFEDKLGLLGLSVPTVIYGHNYRTRSSRVHRWTVVVFDCGDEKLEVRFCLMPARSQPHLPYRVEVVHPA
jgi:chemotaxis protein CheX